MLKIFIDTNVLLHSTDWKIKLDESISKVITQSYRVYVHELVLEEVFEATNRAGKIKQRARIALHLLSNFESYEDEEEYPGTDIALLKTAKREGGVVLTFDKDLMHRCKEQGVPVLYVRGKGKLMLVGFVKGEFSGF